MSFSKYPAYKDSGVEWLGEIPEHWDSGSLRHLIKSVKNGTTLNQTTEADDTVAVSRIETISTGDINFDKVGYVPLIDVAEHFLLIDGDILFSHINSLAMIGNAAMYRGGQPLVHGMNLLCIRPSPEVSNKWLFYWLISKNIRQEIRSRAKPAINQASISIDSVRSLPAVIPPSSEQAQVAQFLDHETARIGALIEEQQRLIALLKEKRQAVISHAVTKGLDPNAPMKDSGVEWLGEAPAHWKTIPLKHLMTLNPVKSAFAGDHAQMCSFVPMEKLKTGHIVLDDERVIVDVFDGYTYFENGDVLQAKVTPCFENKNIAIANQLKNGVGFGSTEINVYRPNEMISSQFLFYRLQEDAYMNVCTASMIGAGGLKRVPTETIQEYRIALPELREQTEIVRFIDETLKQMDDLTACAMKGIDLLYERRFALISAAVTGKIDVRDWQPPFSPTSTQQENTLEVA